MYQANDNVFDADELLEEAASLAASLSANGPEALHSREAKQWQAQSPEHAAAWADVERIMQLAGSYQAPPKETNSHRENTFRSRAVYYGAIAASFMLVAVLSIVLLWGGPTSYQTDIGERLTISLEDGSQVNLNTATEMAVQLSAHERHVELKEGEAYFDVAKDIARPFLVEAGGGVVKVTGTQFSVRSLAEKTRVSVLEGHVQVSSAGDTVSLNAGEQVEFAAGYSPAGLKKVSQVAAAGWRDGLLVYDRVTLKEMADDLNRYFRGRILVPDVADQTVVINAVLRLDSREETLKNLNALLPITIYPGQGRDISLDWNPPSN